MDRRRFVGLWGGLIIVRSIAHAQPAPKVHRVGFLLGATADSVASLFEALVAGLGELGYVEGRNVVFVRRYGSGNMEKLPGLAADLVRQNVDVIVTGTNIVTDLYRRAATYVDKIFHGARPGELPVEQPTKYELAINLKTAKALGVAMPQSLLMRAEEVIQ